VAKLNPWTRLISGSEVAAFQKCEMAWWFAHRVHLAPKKLPDGLFRGVMGHEALSKFYGALKAGNSIEDGRTRALEFVTREVEKATQQMMSGYIPADWFAERLALITFMESTLRDYFNFWAEKDFQRYEIIEVEHMHVGERFFAMRLDVLLREHSTGDLVLMDHKFVKDPYLEKQLLLNSQFPRYMNVLIGDREENVKYGYLNQIRTRKDVTEAEKRFVRRRIDYNATVADRRTRDQESVADEIRELYVLDPIEAKEKVRRTLSDYTCRFCAFARPFMYDLKGDSENFDLELVDNFEKSTYGYN